MSRKDYIPRNADAFNTWFKFVIQYVGERVSGSPPPWGHIPADRFTELQNSYAAWYTAFGKTVGPHSKVETEARDNAKKASEKIIRAFVNQFLRFPPVTDEDRTAMGIPNKKEGRAPVPRPDTVPELTVDTGRIRHLLVHYHDKGSKRKGKPEGVHGVEICWAVLDHPPASVKELINSAFDTNSPLDLEFDESRRGSRVYLCPRWEIEREGIKGDYGEIYSAIVP